LPKTELKEKKTSKRQKRRPKNAVPFANGCRRRHSRVKNIIGRKYTPSSPPPYRRSTIFFVLLQKLRSTLTLTQLDIRGGVGGDAGEKNCFDKGKGE